MDVTNLSSWSDYSSTRIQCIMAWQIDASFADFAAKIMLNIIGTILYMSNVHFPSKLNLL